MNPSEIRRVLAIETSCDDTSVAIVNDQKEVEALCSATRDLDHAQFGGIVPEIASRNHTFFLVPLVSEAISQAKLSWKEIHGIAVTNRPGLIGALIVGITTAKSLAMIYDLPLIGVNHLEGHIVAPLLKGEPGDSPPPDFDFPFLALAVSGGHSTLYDVRAFGEYRVLGQTRDDAAGEAFDKFAKMLGIGFPGGVRVDHLARSGDPLAFEFPKSLMEEGQLEMSFSGLKSAAQRLLSKMSQEDLIVNRANLAASYQETLVDTLLTKLNWAQKQTGYQKIVLTGGVSANSRLREKAKAWANKNKLNLVIPPMRYCTDNAAMIGLAGLWRLKRGERSDLNLGPSPQSLEADFG
jgi:N6-L-threonylcarbamoyladenine synthase